MTKKRSPSGPTGESPEDIFFLHYRVGPYMKKLNKKKLDLLGKKLE
ncbi:MAG: hypothetical protein ACEY3C_07755 [Candidatus Tisiphia sp.]